MNDCNLIAAKFAETESGTALKKKLSNDYGKFVAIASLIYDGTKDSKYTSEFETYLNRYENLTPNDEAKVMLDYYNSKHFDVNYQSVDKEFDKEVTAYGYLSTAAKIFGYRFAGNKFLAFYQSDLIKGKLSEHKEDRLNYYADRCINLTRKIVARNICEIRGLEVSKANKDTIFKELTPMNSKHLDEIARELSESDESIRNTFALYREMATNKIKFFNKVINTDSRLGELRFNSKSVLDNDNSGMGSNFMKSYDLDIKSILATIPKLTSIEKDGNSKYQYDRSDPFGSIDFVDAKLVTASLISGVDRTDLNSFIQSIKNMANTNSELKGLIVLADMLDKNRDIAIKFRRNFVKTIMPKTETRIEYDNVRSIQSNKRSNKIQTIRFDFMNDIKHTIFTVETSEVFNTLNEVNYLAEKYKRLTRSGKYSLPAQSAYNDAINKLTYLAKSYYPSMDKTAIENYIRINNSGEKNAIAANMRHISLLLEDTAKGAIDSQKRKAELDELKKENEKNGETRFIDYNDFISQKFTNQAIYFANELAAYSTTR